MDNYAIADQLSLLAKLMDIHGENAFKSKSYAAAAFTIEKVPQALADLPTEKIAGIRGIGDSVAKKIMELLQTGQLQALQQLLEATPAGVLEMMHIKGLGPKKIHTLWKELHIDSIEQLKEACQENKIAAQKGFGEKTQQNILEAIQFQQQNTGIYLYAQVAPFAEALQAKLLQHFTEANIHLTGDLRRHTETVAGLEWVTTIPKNDLQNYLAAADYALVAEGADWLQVTADNTLPLTFYTVTENEFHTRLFATTGSAPFIKACESLPRWQAASEAGSEDAIFTTLGLPYIPPYLRESETVLQKVQQQGVPAVIQQEEIKGLIHSHSNWSDGAYTIEEMATNLIGLGFEYLVISDHSKAAYYANGLSEQRIQEQHRYIDELNKKLAPFKIYKSIECDILGDGTLDYSNAVLASFDLVIASIHSNLQMTEEKAMQRLLGAITNPYVTILGHMTGRLLARRKGYPVDHKTIIEACAAHQVVIEINASPHRLDIDWRWIEYALEKEVLLSINPDAHTLDDFGYLKYGVLVAQKGGLTKQHNVSSFSRTEFEAFLQKRRQVKGFIP